MAAQRKTSASVAVGQGFIGFGLVALGVAATLATVLGFFGSTWWLFDFAANFRAHLAVVLLLVALAYSLVFSKATGLFFMAMAIVNGLVLLPLYLNNPAPAASGDALSIVSFNAGQRSSIRDTTFRWIESIDPDIVVLVDATSDWTNAVELADPYKILNDMPVDRTYGIAVLAKEHIDAELLRVTSVRDVVVRVEASIAGRPVAIYAIQSRPASNEADAGLRDKYFAEVTRMARQESMSTVVVGDFQSSPWSHQFKNLLADADLVNSLEGYGIQTTWPADRWAFFRLPFDHLVHSEDLTTIDRYLGPAFGVEHRPIVVKLAIAS
jgi:endonuclease/exonuclease/phosphatase (EEP) superfamily protein YafD